MSINHFFIDGVEYSEIPDPCNGVSPMHKSDGSPNVELFVSLGGEVKPAEHLTDKERVCVAFGDLIEELAMKTDKITPAEFLAAARNGISAELIAFAREREVPKEVIAEGRSRIVETMADALRFGVSWNELIVFVASMA